MADLLNCFRTALRQGVLTQPEFEQFSKRYEDLRSTVRADQIKEIMASEIEAEAKNRKRVALLAEGARSRLLETMKGYRNAQGNPDPVEAFELLHHNLGRLMGSAVKSAEELREVLVKEYTGKLADLSQEFRRGVITGDLKRSLNKSTRLRIENMVKEVMGEDTGDPVAKGLAQSWMKVADEMRVRFNELGGAVGELEYGYIPQGHNPEALYNAKFTMPDGTQLAGRSAWVERLMQPGVLYRERMIHPLTKRAMSDAELRDSLGVAWDRITTNGDIDKEVSGVGGGRGAVWTQHADHRFIHFKDAKSWLAYAKDYGSSTDVVHAMMGHIQVMSRDIAHMEIFGPNPNFMRNYLKSWITSQANQVRSFDVVIKEQTAQLKTLTSKLAQPNPDYVQISDRIGEIHTEVAAIRRKHTPQLGGKPSDRNKAKLDALDQELFDLEQQMTAYIVGEKPISVEDAQVKAEMEMLFSEMRSPIAFADRERPGDYARTRLLKADAYWNVMRGGPMAVNSRMADGFQAARNLLTAAALDGAFFSSFSDPAAAQDTLLKLGVKMSKANAARILVMSLKEGILRNNREEAARAWLGWESMMHGFQQQARMAGPMDVRGWTGFVADRVLTTTLLSPFTQGEKHLVGTTIYAEFADHAGKAWDKLPDAPRNILKANGFDSASWDAIRGAPLHETAKGVGWLEPESIQQHAGRELAERYAMLVHRMIRYAVVEGTVESRAVTGNDPPGTARGEMMRSFMQFKGYPFAFVQLHVKRVANEIMNANSVNGRVTAAGYAAAIVITGTLLGGFSMMLRDAARGKDPRKWGDEKFGLDPYFWTEAWMRGSGLGIYSDFLKSTVSRTGKGPTELVSGPLVGLVADTGRLVNEATLVNAQNAIAKVQGKKQTPNRWGKYATRIGKDITPSHWAIDTAVQRIVWDWMLKQTDPEAHKAFRDEKVRAMRTNNQSYWWEPGQAMPGRAPDFTRVPATR